MSSEFDVIVIGSGAGGGVVAGELAQCGRRVLLLEAGPHRISSDFRRWEAKANHELYWPTRFAPLPDGDAVAFISGKCVGGSTTINTSVALRAHPGDIAKWHAATGLTNRKGEPFSLEDLESYYTRVEDMLGVRERSDWEKCVYTAQAGFSALGAELEPVNSYTDPNCAKYGSCMQGCPNDAGKSTMNTYISRALGRCPLDLRSGVRAERVLIEDSPSGRRVVGVEYFDADGAAHQARAPYVVAACGALNTAQLLLRSGLTNGAIGQHVGLHPVHLVYGLFDEVQDTHRVYPISAHCMKFQTDEDGGFVLEASMIVDPISFAVSIRDENGPLWGEPLVDALRGYRHWVGVLAMITDENSASVWIDENGREKIKVDFQERELARIDAALRYGRQVLQTAGARRIIWSGLISTHTQGGCRMGDDPRRSVVDRNGESHEVKGLYVGDGSLVPCTLSVNPSLTIMALATRLAEHLEMAITGETESS